MSHNTFVNDAVRKVSSAAFNTPAMTAFEQSLDKFRTNPKFKVGDVTPIAVSPFGPLGKAKAGFAYMHADIEYANISKNGTAVKVPGLALVRGGSVTVLTFLQCNGVDYVILTEQARAPIGESEYLEAPAGMLDGEARPKFRCGSCRKPLRVIAPVDNEYGDVDGPLGTCPVCKGQLNSASTGLMWD